MALNAFSPSLPVIGGAFALVGSDGQTVTDHSFPDKYKLIYFGYTSCPDVCPTTMADLTIALKKMGAKADAIQPLFITIDPARDTSDLLKAYAAQFWPGLIGLTGTADQIAAVEKQYRVYAAIHRTGDGPNDYQMDHSSIFYLMAPDGAFMTVIPADANPDALAAQIAQQIP